MVIRNIIIFSGVLRRPDFCICENKCVDQLCSNCTAEQRLCFRYTDGTIPILKSKLSIFWFSSVPGQAGFCRTLSNTPKSDLSVVSVSLNSSGRYEFSILYQPDNVHVSPIRIRRHTFYRSVYETTMICAILPHCF